MTVYTNITLTGTDQTSAAQWLAGNGTPAAVSPTVDDVTVVYETVLADHADDDEPVEALLRLVGELSYELDCTAWLVIVDGDVFIYSLYIVGELTDSYGAKAGEAPDGGDAELLCDLYGQPKRAIKTVRALLKKDSLNGADRHAALLDALDLPRMALSAGYETVRTGTLPEGVESADDFMWVEPDEDDA